MSSPQPHRHPAQEPLSLEGAHRRAEFMARIRAGDETAFQELLAAYFSPIVAYIARLRGDRDSAKDVAEEAFVRLWQRRHEWRDEGSVRAFLYRTARNLAIDEARKERVRSRWLRLAALEGQTVRPTQDRDLERKELEIAVDEAILALPPRRREAFTLFYFHSFSYRQIAEIMELRPQAVANYISAAYADLRVRLAPLLPSRILDARP
jgi:RNA polymerase sigma factor (sigma-70 family)